MRRTDLIRASAAVAALTIAHSAVHAAPIGISFVGVSNLNTQFAARGASQFGLEVDDAGGMVSFRFSNAGAGPATITKVYFDDRDGFLGDATLTSGTGVNLIEDARGAKGLKSRHLINPGFRTTRYFAAVPADPIFGADVDEWFQITFDLRTNRGYEYIVANLESGQLRVGLNAEGFDGEGRESFVNGQVVTPRSVPTPGAIGLASVAITLLAGGRRRRSS